MEKVTEKALNFQSYNNDDHDQSDKYNCDQWLTNVFKSIEKIKFDAGSMCLVDLLPVELLFNSYHKFNLLI